MGPSSFQHPYHHRFILIFMLQELLRSLCLALMVCHDKEFKFEFINPMMIFRFYSAMDHQRQLDLHGRPNSVSKI